jgi:hypothetical protein
MTLDAGGLKHWHDFLPEIHLAHARRVGSESGTARQIIERMQWHISLPHAEMGRQGKQSGEGDEHGHRRQTSVSASVFTAALKASEAMADHRNDPVPVEHQMNDQDE